MKDTNEFVMKDFFSAEIEKFAGMVKRGFDDIMERMDRRFETVEQSLHELKTDSGELKEKMMKIEDRLNSIEDVLKPTISQINDHEERISSLEMGAA